MNVKYCCLNSPGVEREAEAYFSREESLSGTGLLVSFREVLVAALSVALVVVLVSREVPVPERKRSNAETDRGVSFIMLCKCKS